jgi:hypothetical protein
VGVPYQLELTCNGQTRHLYDTEKYDLGQTNVVGLDDGTVDVQVVMTLADGTVVRDRIRLVVKAKRYGKSKQTSEWLAKARAHLAKYPLERYPASATRLRDRLLDHVRALVNDGASADEIVPLLQEAAGLIRHERKPNPRGQPHLDRLGESRAVKAITESCFSVGSPEAFDVARQAYDSFQARLRAEGPDDRIERDLVTILLRLANLAVGANNDLGAARKYYEEYHQLLRASGRTPESLDEWWPK